MSTDHDQCRPAGPGGGQATPAADLGQRRLRGGGGHDRADGRGPGPERRPAGRRARARRRHRQRQRRPGRRPLRLRGDRHRLRPRPAGAGQGPGGRRRAGDRVRRGRRREPRVPRRLLRRASCPASGSCSPQARSRRRPSCCGSAGRAAPSAWSTGRRRASSASCSAPSASTSRRRPGVRPPTQWGTEERLGELLGDAVSRLEVQRRSFVFRFRSPDDFATFFRDNYGPVHKAFGALDEPGRERLYDGPDRARPRARPGGGAVGGDARRVPGGGRDPQVARCPAGCGRWPGGRG